MFLKSRSIICDATKYLGINIFTRIMHDFNKGYIEWGIFTEKNDLKEYKVIDSDEFDGRGNLNKINTVNHAHIFIPDHLKNIIDKVKEDRVSF